MEVSCTWQRRAWDASTANSTAFRFSTGNAPGRPRHTGQTLLLGGAPNRVEHPQKILVCVRSWTCTSSPITGSYFSRTAAEIRVLVAMEELYGLTAVSKNAGLLACTEQHP